MMNNETLKQMGKDCISLIIRKTSKEMTKDEFYIELMNLHKKYQMEGHDPPLTIFQVEHYFDLKEMQWIDRGPKLEDKPLRISTHIQPYNFQEASEMFIRHWDKPKERLPYKDDDPF